MSGVLERLAEVIAKRAGADPDGSHTAALLAKGPGKCAEKFGEEAVEAVVAAAGGDRAGLTYEAADVLYHLQVMLAASRCILVRGPRGARTPRGRVGHCRKGLALPLSAQASPHVGARSAQPAKTFSSATTM